jgi:hypothetical protein
LHSSRIGICRIKGSRPSVARNEGEFIGYCWQYTGRNVYAVRSLNVGK